MHARSARGLSFRRLLWLSEGGTAERDRAQATTPPNKRMQLTKLRAAPVLQAEVPPCAPAGGMDGGTASQLIRGVGRTKSDEARVP